MCRGSEISVVMIDRVLAHADLGECDLVNVPPLRTKDEKCAIVT